MMIENSKRILNSELREEKTEQTNDSTVKILSDDKVIQIILNKEKIKTLTPFELNNTILASISPLFLNFNARTPIVNQQNNKKFSKFKHIAFFIEHMPHYTGGRYSIYHQAVLLSQYTNVTVITNEKPPFYDDFKDYYNDNFSLITTFDWLMGEELNNYDLIVGCPMKSGVYAHHYAKKHNLPLYMIIFESPNWVSKYRDGADSQEDYWSEYKKCLYGADKIMVPSIESKKHLIEWLDRKSFDDKIFVVYPCINQVVADKEKKKIHIKHSNHKYNIVYISRMTPGKTILPLLKKFPKDKYHFDIIGKVWFDSKNELKNLVSKGYDITVHEKIGDEEKFKIIANADVMAFPTKFEGFGMPPMEALYFDVPVVAYELPVLKEIYGDSINYVPLGNEKMFTHILTQVCENKQCSEEDRALETKESFTNRNIFPLIKTCANNLMEIFNIPKISTGTIVYNGADYIECAIKSIYGVVNQIIIVDGAVKDYGAEKPYSIDGTIEIVKRIKKEIDILDKIEIYETDRFYSDKIEMQNKIACNVKGEYYVKLDADEIWKPETLIDAVSVMIEQKIDVLRMPFYHFWLSFKNIAVDNGGKWSTKHPRIWKWNENFIHIKSFNYFQDIENGKKVSLPNYNEQEYNGDKIYHFGYVRDSFRLKQKLEYYRTRGIEKFFNNTIESWRKLSDKTQPTQDSDSWAETFIGKLPQIMYTHPFVSFDDIRKLV